MPNNTQEIDLNEEIEDEQYQYQTQHHQRSPYPHKQAAPANSHQQAPKNDTILQSIREVLEVLDFQQVGYHLYFVAEHDAERLRHVAEANGIVLLEPARRFNANNFNYSSNTNAQEHYFAQQQVPFEQQSMPQQQIHHSTMMMPQPPQQLPASPPMLSSPQHHHQPQQQVVQQEPPQWSYTLPSHLVSHRIVPRERKPKKDKLEKAQNRMLKQQKKKEKKLAAPQTHPIQAEKKKNRRKQGYQLQQDPAAWNNLQKALNKASTSEQTHAEPEQQQQQAIPVEAGQDRKSNE